MNRQCRKTLVVAVSFTLLTLALACVLSPISWSPDGRWIALTCWREEKKGDQEQNYSELWLVSPRPIERRRLFVTPGTMLGGPTWSPDGKGIYVVDLPSEKTSGPAVLRFVPLDGQQRAVVSSPVKEEAGGAALAAPAISPDGKKIAFIRDKANVVVATIEGRIERVIEGGEPGTVAWAPDGRWLAVVSGGDQNLAIQFFDTQSSESLILDMRYRSLAWLPDGKRYVALKGQSGDTKQKPSIAVLEGIATRREAASLDLDVKVAGPLVPSRKGDAVFFAREEEGDQSPGICKLDLGNGKLQTIYETPGPVVAWSVSPDGRSLAFRESAIGKDSGGDSFVGVLDLTTTTEPIYLAVDDKQWAAAIKGYTDELKKAEAGKMTLKEEKAAGLAITQAERFLAAFRRDFPNSPLLAEATAAVKQARAALKEAGVSLSPGGGTTRW